MRIGILPLGRNTFDVPLAQQKLDAMLASLDASGHDIIGPRALLFDTVSTQAALAALQGDKLDLLLLLQVTFTDASMTVAAANAIDAPLAIWAIRDPRDGGRLRLNSFCGFNLASHALGLAGRPFGWLFADPDDTDADTLSDLLNGKRPSGILQPAAIPAATPKGQAIADALKGKKIARIGERPDGFDTCNYNEKSLNDLTGIKVDALSLDTLFDTASNIAPDRVQATRDTVSTELPDLDQLDQTELDRSLALKLGLDEIRKANSYDAFALRCWPETFTQYGGAICGPASMLGEARVPCACEADVYGALTQLILQEAANAPVFLADLVDMDDTDNSGVVWHCGQAPLSMRAPGTTPSATVHTNRKMPLLYEFPLKPGPVTLMRISQSHNVPKMILSAGEMLDRPMAYTGTSGVLRFERPVNDVLNDVIASGLEHHMALTYGDHRDTLRGVAGALGLPLLEI